MKKGLLDLLLDTTSSLKNQIEMLIDKKNNFFKDFGNYNQN